MKIVSFFEERPDEVPAGGRLYELAWKPRYDRTEDSERPAPLARLRYFADGPTAIAGPPSGVIKGAVLEYVVDDQVQFMRAGSGPGHGGVLRLLLSRRNPGLTRREFAWHWRNVHAPLALGLEPSYDYYITNIVQDTHEDWDGVLEEWFADEETFDAHEEGLKGRKLAVADDYALFLAPDVESPQWLGREIPSSL